MAPIGPQPCTFQGLETGADKYCLVNIIRFSPTMSPLESYREPQRESQDGSQLDPVDMPSTSADADIDAHSHAVEIGNAAVDLAPAPIQRDDFYTGPPPAPELAPSIDNLRDTRLSDLSAADTQSLRYRKPKTGFSTASPAWSTDCDGQPFSFLGSAGVMAIGTNQLSQSSFSYILAPFRRNAPIRLRPKAW